MLDTPETRSALAEIVATPPKAPAETITIAPKSDTQMPHKPRAPFVRGKLLTTNPPHPLIKAADNELVLRGMAYGTRKPVLADRPGSYGQHLRNYFNWLKVKPEEATREDIRRFLVQMATSGRVSAGYCRGARAALIMLYLSGVQAEGLAVSWRQAWRSSVGALCPACLRRREGESRHP